MILKITAEVIGNILITKTIAVRKQSCIISLFYDADTNKIMISIQKHLKHPELSIPLCIMENGITQFALQHSEEEEDMLRLIKHIESFGGLDNHVEKILWEFSKYDWISEDGDTVISPIFSLQRKRKDDDRKPSLISERWLQDTVLYADMMKDLYIPFSFFREGCNYFHAEKYIMAFASYYWMLEYFFVAKRGYGINNNAHKEYMCLNTCLRATLLYVQNQNDTNFVWLQAELKERNKCYDEEGLLFVINQNRDKILHTPKKNADKRVFNEHKYRSLAFITMNLCLNVQIKMRLLPFVKKNAVEDFLSQMPREIKNE